jgi:hypothetical protein
VSERLKLRAEDEADLTVLSSVLQDALVPVGDLVYLPDEKRFVMMANRFVWEECTDVTLPPESASKEVYHRVHCGVCFETVTAVKKRGIEQGDGARVLELLALKPDGRAIELLFAGGAAIRLETERLFAHVADVDEPWPTQWRPRHPDVA